jgi:hypothetical protein
MIGVITLSGVTFGGNCGSNEFSLTTFRDTASDDIADGLALLTQGFVTGVFAGLAADGPSDQTETEATP